MPSFVPYRYFFCSWPFLTRIVAAGGVDAACGAQPIGVVISGTVAGVLPVCASAGAAVSSVERARTVTTLRCIGLAFRLFRQFSLQGFELLFRFDQEFALGELRDQPLQERQRQRLLLEFEIRLRQIEIDGIASCTRDRSSGSN